MRISGRMSSAAEAAAGPSTEAVARVRRSGGPPAARQSREQRSLKHRCRPVRTRLNPWMAHRGDVAHDRPCRVVPVGTTKIDACLCGRPSGTGLGEDEDDVGRRGVRGEPLVPVDDPLVAVRGPHVVPITVGSAPARNELGERERTGISPRRLGHSQRSFCASVAPWASSSMLPLSGACTPKVGHRDHAAADDLRHQRKLQLTEAWPPSFGSRNAAHSPSALDRDPGGAA